jgi:hypothetical protein
MRHVGQLPSSQPDFGVPHSGHVSGWFTVSVITSLYQFSHKSGRMLQAASRLFRKNHE